MAFTQFLFIPFIFIFTLNSLSRLQDTSSHFLSDPADPGKTPRTTHVPKTAFVAFLKHYIGLWKTHPQTPIPVKKPPVIQVYQHTPTRSDHYALTLFPKPLGTRILGYQLMHAPTTRSETSFPFLYHNRHTRPLSPQTCPPRKKTVPSSSPSSTIFPTRTGSTPASKSQGAMTKITCLSTNPVQETALPGRRHVRRPPAWTPSHLQQPSNRDVRLLKPPLAKRGRSALTPNLNTRSTSPTKKNLRIHPLLYPPDPASKTYSCTSPSSSPGPESRISNSYLFLLAPENQLRAHVSGPTPAA
ncbi:hypothetical protein MMC28_003975 [Mycoblastus sanguinarius]|nr:hypothetical protein [Mycoblastus sanguinarius]